LLLCSKMMSALAECGTIKTVSQARARIEATKYSPDRPTLSVALGMGYSVSKPGNKPAPAVSSVCKPKPLMDCSINLFSV
jgi:hypothetical protein